MPFDLQSGARRAAVRRICCVILVCLGTVSGVSGAATFTEVSKDAGAFQAECSYFVAPGGDDAGTGDADAPWATLEHAVATVEPGDVVCVRAGTYGRGAELDLFVSGTSEAPIELVAIEPGVVVSGGINVRPGTHHLRLQGLQIEAPGQWGVALWGDNGDVVLSDLRITGGEVGVRLTVGDPAGAAVLGPISGVVIERTTVRDTEIAGVACAPGPCTELVLSDVEVVGSGGVGIEIAGAGVVIEGSRIADSGGDGVVVRHRLQEVAGDPLEPRLDQRAATGTTRVLDSHIVRSRGVGVRLVGGGAVVNCEIVDSGLSAVVASEGPARLVNSTLAACLQCRSLVEVVGGSSGASTSAQVLNTILFNDSPTMSGRLVTVSDGAELELAGSLLYNPFGESQVVCVGRAGGESCVDAAGLDRLVTGEQRGARWAEPRFFAADLGDFHLTATSPAVDGGISDVAPSMDIEGQPRDVASDIGAYEHRAGRCLLACSADGPERVAVQEAFTLTAAVRSAGCAQEPDLRWDLDGAAEPATTSTVRHTVAEPGVVHWAMEASVGDRVCSTGGVIEAVATRTDQLQGGRSESTGRNVIAKGPARQASISWWTIDGGGGTSTGGAYTLSGTIGQPDASNPMTGGAYTLTGGFWAGVGPRVCDVDRSGTCDAQDLAWVVWCADDSGCGSPGDPDVNNDALVDGGDIEVVISGVY